VRARGLPLLLTLLALSSAAGAHVVDEYLQATLVVIEPADVRLKLYLTPGTDVAEQVLAVIDRDRDGAISTDEATAYADLLKRDLLLRLDDRNVALKLTASSFAAPDEIRTGDGIIKVEFSAVLGALPPGSHRLTLDNAHLPKIGVYLFNAAQPNSALIQVRGQTRNANQSRGEIEFTYDPPAAPRKPRGPILLVAVVVLVALFGGWRARRNSPRT